MSTTRMLRESDSFPTVNAHGVPLPRIDIGVGETTAQWDGLSLKHSRQDLDEGICRFDRFNVVVSLGPSRYTEFRFDGGKLGSHITHPGCVSIFAPEQDLWVLWRSQCEHIVLSLDDAALLRTAEEFHLKGGCSLGQDPVIDDQLVVQMALSLKKEAIQGLPHGSLYGDQMSGMLLHHLLRNYPDRTRQSVFFRGGMAPRNLRQITNYIEDHLHEDLKLAELANLVTMTPQHFSRCFREETGLPPYRYVLKRRIAKAKDLLRQTNLSIGDIALAVGYESPSHFSKLFRQDCGLTPNKYRRSL